MAKHSIQDVIEQNSALNQELKVNKGKNITKQAVNPINPLLAKQARLAETLAKLRKRKP